MIKGQKVVCINDAFPEFVHAIYKQLPVKGDTYTIREVFLGREKIVKGGDSATVGLLLEELHNPPDPFHKGEQELGFSSERFAPLEELPAEEEEEEAAGVLTGAWANVGASLADALFQAGRRQATPLPAAQLAICGRDGSGQSRWKNLPRGWSVRS